MTKKQTSLYVVVVADHRVEGEVIESGLPSGQYACFIGEDQDAIVEKAQETVRGWSFSSGNSVSRVDGKPYRLLVGELNGVVKRAIEYEVVPL